MSPCIIVQPLPKVPAIVYIAAMAGGNKKKRNRAQYEKDIADGESSTSIGATPAKLRGEDSTTPMQDGKEKDSGSEEWTTVGRGGKKQKKSNYPSLGYSELHKLNSSVNINHLQGLVLYCLADGNMAPNWVSVRHHNMIRKAVVLFVPGLERGMFDGSIELECPEEDLIDFSDPASGADVVLANVDDLIDISEAPKIANPFTEDRTRSGSLLDFANPNNGHNKGLEEGDKSGPAVAIDLKHRAESNGYIVRARPQSPDDYLPIPLASDKLPLPLSPLADTFTHLWPVKAPGDERYGKVHSPLHAMLNSPVPKTQEEKIEDKQIKGPKPARVGRDWENRRTPITAFVATKEELQENDYLLHPVWFTDPAERTASLGRRKLDKQTATDGWTDTLVADLDDGSIADEDIQKGSITAGRGVLAMDCEMCLVEGGEMALTRISLVEWDGSVIMDEFVMPNKPIIDYLTPYSGITPAKLQNIATTLDDIQQRLRKLVTPKHVLIGHSLNADLLALKMTHPFIIDTSILYPHPRGSPMKSSLKWLAQKYLNREIQKGHGTNGHDSIEDARACLDLVKMKCERGPLWGTSEATNESIFKRLKRSPRPGMAHDTSDGKTGAIVDHGTPEKNFGSMASYCIGCKSDEEVVTGVKRAVLGDEDGSYIPGGGVDFTWARFQELAALRGWLLDYRHSTTTQSQEEASPTALSAVVTKTVQHIKTIRDFLPPCTLLIVCSGTGDPRELGRLQEMKRTYKREFYTKKWDDLSIKWTDVEEQSLKAAVRKARQGVGLVAVI